jgi:hypothetical protein
VPTASLIAWLLVAAESGLPVSSLGRRDPELTRRQHVLRTIMGRVLQGRSELFENRWLDQLAAVCCLGETEIELLATSRDESGHPVDPPALRGAIARSLRSGLAAGRVAEGRPTGVVTSAARTLPRDIASFTGREPELRQVMAARPTPCTTWGRPGG